MKMRAHLIISGKVQGVFFRFRTAERVRRIGVAGWIRNLPDGRVEAVFEGEEETVEAMIDFCKIGPPGALVKGIEIQQEAYTGEYKGFTVT